MGSRSAVKERPLRAPRQGKPKADSPTEIASCKHHWIIESPHGALSSGRCKLCGEEREFRNSAQDYIWDDDSSSGGGYNSWSGVRSTPKSSTADDEGIAASGSNPAIAVAV